MPARQRAVQHHLGQVAWRCARACARAANAPPAAHAEPRHTTGSATHCLAAAVRPLLLRQRLSLHPPSCPLAGTGIVTLAIFLLFLVQWAVGALELLSLAQSEALWVASDWLVNSLFSCALLHGIAPAACRLSPWPEVAGAGVGEDGSCPQHVAPCRAGIIPRAGGRLTLPPLAGIYVIQDARLQATKDGLEEQNRADAARAFTDMMEQKARGRWFDAMLSLSLPKISLSRIWTSQV